MVWTFVCFKSSLSALHSLLRESFCFLVQILFLPGYFSQEQDGPDCGSHSPHCMSVLAWKGYKTQSHGRQGSSADLKGHCKWQFTYSFTVSWLSLFYPKTCACAPLVLTVVLIWLHSKLIWLITSSLNCLLLFCSPLNCFGLLRGQPSTSLLGYTLVFQLRPNSPNFESWEPANGTCS